MFNINNKKFTQLIESFKQKIVQKFTENYTFNNK